jgi:hypothetical protein
MRHSRGRLALAPVGRGGWLMCLTVGLLLLAVPPAWAHHVVGIYEGTDAQGARVGFEVKGTGSYLGGFGAATAGKTDAGQDCSPLYPPLNNAADIVDHAFSNTISEVFGSITFSLTMSVPSSRPRVPAAPSGSPPTLGWLLRVSRRLARHATPGR